MEKNRSEFIYLSPRTARPLLILLASGMYIYALIVNGKVLDSKKLAVVR